ncbi:hypothetical protein AAVH_18787 [Aphelenchoides avenae]|nr:hypothetical protein AAVH_18787 [Aphelenchus avenae]
MSSTLGPLAIHQVLSFTEQDYRRRKKNLRNAKRVPQLRLMARHISPMWSHICELYLAGYCPPSMDYLRSPELLLGLKNALDSEDMRIVFGHGKPMVFSADAIPQRLVSKLVQAFVRLREEPASLDITVNLSHADAERSSGAQCTSASHEPVAKSLEDMWPEVYACHLPCAACTTLRSMLESIPLPGERSRESTEYATEIFHVVSNNFDKKLTLELTFALGDPQTHAPATASRIEKMELRQLVAYLDEKPCNPLRDDIARKRKTILLIPDFATEVYGFLDRVHIGASLIASDGLSELLSKLKNRLPVHHLTCAFEAETVEDELDFHLFTGAYRCVLHHFRRDIAYTDVRRLVIPSTEGPAADGALIPYYANDRFVLRMLAALVVGRNFSVGRLQMHAWDGKLTDYRSMDVIFGGGLRLDALHLYIGRQGLTNLIKTVDFLRMPTVQGLKELKFLPVNAKLKRPRRGKSLPRHRGAVVASPLWLSGIRLLRNCSYYEVTYEPDRHLESIALKLVHICEKFERGEIAELCGHFKFAVRRRHVTFSFNERNLFMSHYGPAFWGTWDVYRFWNAATGECLQAYVGHRVPGDWFDSVLHIVNYVGVIPYLTF